jgi:predicted membrane chloride channel (bestrophin family)
MCVMKVARGTRVSDPRRSRPSYCPQSLCPRVFSLRRSLASPVAEYILSSERNTMCHVASSRNIEGEVILSPPSTSNSQGGRQLSEFTFKRWEEHRSTARYNRHIFGIFSSSIFRGLAQPLVTVGAIATAVCLYESNVVPQYDLMPSLLMPTAPFDLTSFALALLLVFRTNSSYDRFVEVTSVWSGLGNRARDTMRQCISHIKHDCDEDLHPLAGAMCRWVVAYVRALKCEVVEDSDLRKELENVLTEEETAALLNSRHRPSFAVSILTELGAAAPLNESHRIRLDENLTYFEDAVGSCERILTQPIPLAYSRHTSRFMVIWLSALPFGLYQTCGLATIPLTMVVAFLLLGIDEIGVQIEEPLGLLPLDNLCDEIEGDLFCMLQEGVEIKRTAKMSTGMYGGSYSPLMNYGAEEVTSSAGHREWQETPRERFN